MLTVLKSGILTTIQDNGRRMGSMGVPVSGPMDRKSAYLANLILDNDMDDALLECTYTGPSLQFHTPTVVAVQGAQAQVYINDIPKSSASAIHIDKDDVLSFGKFEMGSRCYVAIKGGIQSQQIIGSRSTCYTAGLLKPIQRGDQLEYHSTKGHVASSISFKRTLGNTILNAYEGPEFSILSQDQQVKLGQSAFSIRSTSNRMAYRVDHTLALTHSVSLLSSGTMPGTVQLTPSGELIFLMRDGQTTGGYPRILQLEEDAISDLAQLRAGEQFTLNLLKL